MSGRGEAVGVSGGRGPEPFSTFVNTFLMVCGSGGTNSLSKRYRSALGGKRKRKRRCW